MKYIANNIVGARKEDMTYKGKLKKLNKLAIPLIIQSVAGLIIGFADQAMVGSISLFAYSAVGVIGGLLMSLAGVVGVMSIAFNISGAKAFGRGAKADFKEEFIATMVMNIIVGAIFFIFILLFKELILKGFYGFEGEVLVVARKYLVIMSPYIMIQIIVFTFSSVFKITNQTKYTMIGATGSAVLNLILNYILIFGKFGFPRLGVQGAAIATISSVGANLIFYCFVLRKEGLFRLRKGGNYIEKMKKNTKLSIPLIGQELLEETVFVVVLNKLIVDIGIHEITAYLIMVQMIHILLMPMYMYGTATLTMVSGEDDIEQLRTIPKLGVGAAFGMYVIIGMVFLVFRENIAGIISKDPEVIKIAAGMFIYMLMANTFRVAATIYKMALQALEDLSYVLYSTAVVNTLTLILVFVAVKFTSTGIIGIVTLMGINYAVMLKVYLGRFKAKTNKELSLAL